MDAPAEIKAVADRYIQRDGSAGANRLPVLAREINAAIREEKAQERKADDHAKKSEAARKAAMEWRLKIGAYMIEAKALLPHGQWLPWLRDNCALSERSAQLYMRVASHKEEIEAKSATGGNVADLSVRAANASIAKPREPATPDAAKPHEYAEPVVPPGFPTDPNPKYDPAELEAVLVEFLAGVLHRYPKLTDDFIYGVFDGALSLRRKGRGAVDTKTKDHFLIGVFLMILREKTPHLSKQEVRTICEGVVRKWRPSRAKAIAAAA